jgi:hypothetical protein
MKHKAEESLDILSYPAWESPCSGCKCGTSDCRDCKNAVAVLNLEDLINCQLTVDEIEMIQNYFKRAIKYCEHCITETDYPFKENRKNEIIKIKSMNRKFQKQKEMWVSEDETN